MRGRLVRYVLVGGSHRIGVPVLIYLLSAFVASQGGDNKCVSVVNKVDRGRMVLDTAALRAVNGSVQRIVDCIPAGTKLIVKVDELPMGNGLVIDKAMSIISAKSAAVMRGCQQGLEIRSSNVTLRGFTIHSCSTNDTHGVIHIDSAKNIVLDRIRFVNNTNDQGPGCLSIRESECNLTNISAANNSGKLGGVLIGENSQITVVTSNFHGNKGLAGAGFKSPGSILSLRGGSFAVRDTEFADNVSENIGAAIFFTGKRLEVTRTKFIGSTENSTINLNENGSAIIAFNFSEARITDSHFLKNNGKTAGGCFFENLEGKIAKVQISQCTFENNKAGNYGGGVHLSGGNSLGIIAYVSTTEFRSNTANVAGGGLFSSRLERLEIDNVVFHSNKCNRDGGGIFSVVTKTGIITSSVFTSNHAVNGGGLCLKEYDNYYLSQKWLVSNTLYTKNRAEDTGGGVYVSAWLHITVSNSTFLSNSARGQGGALGAEGHQDWDVQLFVDSTSFTGNTAGTKKCWTTRSSIEKPISSGGALSIVGTRAVCTNLEFIRNRGGVGGALAVWHASTLNISDFFMLKNSAIHGGAVGIISTENVLIYDGRFTDNSARKGGAVFVQGSSAKYYDTSKLKGTFHDLLSMSREIPSLNNITFLRNHAVVEGGGLDVLSQTLVCKDCKFDSNTAGSNTQKLGGKGGGLTSRSEALVILNYTTITSCAAMVGGGIAVDDAALIASNLSLVSNTAWDVGAAIDAIVYPRLSDKSSLPVECHGCSFEGNQAKRAGIIYISVKEVYDLDFEPGTHTYNLPPVPTVLKMGLLSSPGHKKSHLTHVLLNNTYFADNVVQSSGPLMFLTDIRDVEICCGDTATCSTGPNLRASRCVKRDTIYQNGTFLGTIMQDVSISPGIIKDHSSGDFISDLNITLLDSFNTMAYVEAFVTFHKLGDDIEISGAPVEGTIILGSSIMTGIKLRAAPGEYTVGITVETYNPEEEVLIEKNITVVVRECRVGEIFIRNNTECRKCAANFYSFHPYNPSCISCPKGKAQCDGTAVGPLDGYWHNSSHSDILVRCLGKSACKYLNRTGALMMEAHSNLELGMNWNNGYPLCNKGYKDVLCGSCEEGYGKDSKFDCFPCTGMLKMVLLLILSAMVLAGMACVFVRGARCYAERKLSNINISVSKRASPCTLIHEMQSYCTIHGSQSLDIQDDTLCGTENPRNSEEILKILINFLQVSATITSLEVGWEGIVEKMLQSFNWASQITIGASAYSSSCAFKNPHRFLHADLLVVTLPLMVWVGFAVLGAIFYLSRGNFLPELKTFWFVSAMAILDISYIGLTQKTIHFFYCVGVDLPGGKMLFWAEDTSIKCYSSPHKYIVYFVGVPLMLFVCLGFPIILFVQLYRRRGRLDSPVVILHYGYFFKSYRPQFPYWEVFVQVRKALLAVISVLSLTLTDDLEMYAASCILLVALTLQNYCRPYVQAKLNNMESASLSISAFVCILEGMLQNPDRNKYLKHVLLVIIVALLFAFVGYMVIRSIYEWVIERDASVQWTGGSLSFLRVFVCLLYSQAQSQLKNAAKVVGDSMKDGLSAISSIRSRDA